MAKVMLTCALTGAGDTAGKSPRVPVTPQQIAADAIAVARATRSHRRRDRPNRPKDTDPVKKPCFDRGLILSIVFNVEEGAGMSERDPGPEMVDELQAVTATRRIQLETRRAIADLFAAHRGIDDGAMQPA